MTAPIVKVMVANKLPATVLAQVFLLVIAGFAVSLYILPTATGTANGILSFHTSNIPCLRCFLFARRLSAYILGHHLIFIRFFHKVNRPKKSGGSTICERYPHEGKNSAPQNTSPKCVNVPSGYSKKSAHSVLPTGLPSRRLRPSGCLVPQASGRTKLRYCSPTGAERPHQGAGT